MKIYADPTVRAARQLLGDVLLIVWIAVWVKVALVVREVTLSLAVPAKKLASASAGLADQLREAGQNVGEAPLVGEEIRAPFDGAGAAADEIARAGAAQAEAIAELALWLPLAVGATPILIASAVYLPARLRFIREATAGQRFIDDMTDLDLLALRSMSRQPLHMLARVSSDPARAWRDGDPAVMRALAELELRDAGLSSRDR